jgi:hypothetical protein
VPARVRHTRTMTMPAQLDLFAHGRDLMLRNDVAAAVERCDAGAARARLRLLDDEFPDDPQRPELATLVAALERERTAPLATHADVAAEREALESVIAPAAQRVLGADAALAWLRPWWLRLAARAAGLPFVAAHADDHAAALALRAGEWAAAEHAVEAIESWRRIPAPLAWMIEARCRRGRVDDAWALIAELAWIAPARLDALLRRLREPVVDRLLRRFDASFEGGEGDADIAWFPAWVLIDTPALAPQFALAQPAQHDAPERALRLMVELLGLERQGRQHDLVQRRRALRDLHPALYAFYLCTR